MRKRFVAIGEAMIEMSPGAGGHWRMGFAGDTLNTAVYARHLLPADWQVDYFTALGADRYSRALSDFIASRGIGTEKIVTVPERRPGLYFIHQEAGDRHFTYWRDRSAARLLAEDEAALNASMEGAAIVYVSGITLAILDTVGRIRLLAALNRARAAGARIAFDPNIRPALWNEEADIRQVLAEAGAVCDVVLPTFDDEAALFGDEDVQRTRDRYAQWGASEIVVKNGAEPALASIDGQSALVAPLVTSDVIDATGAGDSFNGAYLAARAAGAGLHEAVSLAHRVAAVCIRHHGALVPVEALGEFDTPFSVVTP